MAVTLCSACPPTRPASLASVPSLPPLPREGTGPRDTVTSQVAGMANSSSVNLGNTVAVMLLELRRHLNGCKDCHNAMRSNDYDAVCKWTKGRILHIANRWDASIGMRLKAKRSGDVHCYPCPDTSKHGQAYAMAAEPVLVVGFPDRLF